MKQDIMMIVPQTQHISQVCKELELWGMHIYEVEKINSVGAKLALHSPAFLLIDIGMAGARQFIADTSRSLLYPPPYIIVSSEFHHITDFFTMLDLGADACVGKPIKVQEILAVINSVFRRERKIARQHFGRLDSCIEYKDLVIDPFRRTVKMREKSILLTVKEFDILYLLACRLGDVLTKQEIYESIWKTEYGAVASNVSGHIFSIRQKLGLESNDKEYIQTVFGIGYRFGVVE